MDLSQYSDEELSTFLGGLAQSQTDHMLYLIVKLIFCFLFWRFVIIPLYREITHLIESPISERIHEICNFILALSRGCLFVGIIYFTISLKIIEVNLCLCSFCLMKIAYKDISSLWYRDIIGTFINLFRKL